MDDATRLAARFDRAMVQRRRQWPTRVGFAVAISVLFMAYTNPWISGGWAVIYIAVQIIELAAFAPERGDWSSPKRRAMAKRLLAVSSAVFASLALLDAYHGEAWGLAAGMMILTGAMMTTAVNLSPSPEAMKAATVPIVVCTLLMPLVAWLTGGPIGPIVGVAIASLLFIAGGLTNVRALERNLEAAEDAQLEIERRRAQAEAAVEAKSAYVAMIAHELRTPLTAIGAGASALESRFNGSPDAAEAQLISQAAEMMNRLLTDLLDLSKLEAGRMTLEQVPYDLRALVGDLARLWAPRASEKGVAVEVVGADRLPQWVTGDSLRLRQILNNLLSNALKFTERGQVTLKIELVDETRGRVALNFIVSDTGPGLPPQVIDRIFVPFDQGGAGTARSYGGTGLGLPISRELAQLLGGDLVAANDPAGGAVFTLDVSLPLAAAPEPGQAPAPRTRESALQILIVDDHEINRRALRVMLEALGAEIAEAAGGLDALTELQRRPFDLVILDMHMPVMDGPETARRLRALPGPNRDTPLIAATGATDPKDQAACRAAGMIGFVAKPIRAADLFAALEQALAPAQADGENAQVA